jgi:purine nucleoside permease
MENFFIDDQFYNQICDFVDANLWGDEDIAELPDDWQQEIELGVSKPVFQVTESDIEYFIYRLSEDNKDMMPEDYDENDEWVKKLKKAFTQNISLDKINHDIPHLYYHSGAKAVLTKKDLL